MRQDLQDGRCYPSPLLSTQHSPPLPHTNNKLQPHYLQGDNGEPITDGLPYDLQVATTAIDMWAIGVLLYLFITGENLFPVNRDDDLVSAESMLTLVGEFRIGR